jgi:hypothetical protein
MQMLQENAIADAGSNDRSKIIEKQSTAIPQTGSLQFSSVPAQATTSTGTYLPLMEVG